MSYLTFFSRQTRGWLSVFVLLLMPFWAKAQVWQSATGVKATGIIGAGTSTFHKIGSITVSKQVRDATGNTYFVGSFTGIATFGSISIGDSLCDYSVAFVAKQNTTGQWLWATAGGTIPDQLFGQSLALDGSGNVVITGMLMGSATFGTTTLVESGGYLAGLNGTTGQWQWAQSFYAVTPSAIAINPTTNDLYLTGTTTDITNLGPLTVNPGQFTARRNSAGQWVWASAMGGDALAVTSGGDLYMAGNGVLSRVTAAGTVSWTTQSPANGGPGLRIMSIVTDGTGDAYVTGAMASGTVTLGASTLRSKGPWDVFVAKISAAGQWQWGAVAGNTGYDYGTSLALAANGDVYVTGIFDSNLTVRFGQQVIGGTVSQTFLAKVSATTRQWQWALPLPQGRYNSNGANPLNPETNLGYPSLTVSPTGAVVVTGLAVASAKFGTTTVAGPGMFVARLNDVLPPAPTVTSFTPTSGPWFTTVTITGTNLSQARSVAFNGTVDTAEVVLSDTQIQAKVPLNATTGKISVTTTGGTGTSAGNFTVTYPPIITGFTPPSGPVGTIVTLTGYNFTGLTAAAIGTKAITTFAATSATTATVEIPSTGTTGKLSLTNAAGTGSSTAYFTVTTSAPAISIVPDSVWPGQTFVITGSRLTGATAVKINGMAMSSYTVVSATQINAVAPLGATKGRITVTTSGGTATSTKDVGIARAVVTMAIDTLAAAAGTQVVVPVRVTTAAPWLQALQASFTWDATRLQLVTVEQFGLSGMSLADFGTATAASGRLTCLWTYPSGTAASLASGTVLFALRFTVVGTVAPGSVMPVQFSATPLKTMGVRGDLLPYILTLRDGQVRVPSASVVTGQIRTAGGAGVPGTLVLARRTNANLNVLTPANGKFSFPSALASSYTLIPGKANDVTVTNGITVADLSLIQRHVLGSQLLGNAYKVIAADVDKSGAVTSLDVVLVRDMLLGNRTSFPKGRLWQFVRSNQTFSNANSPWPFDTSRVVSNLATATAQDFIGVKLGDVDGSWNPAIARPAAGTAPLALQLTGAQVVSGQRFRVPLITAEATLLGGLQGTVVWDESLLQLVGTQPGALPGLLTRPHAPGQLTLVWTDAAGQAQPLAAGTVLGWLEFEAMESAGAIGMVALESRATDLLAIDGALQPLTVQVEPATITIAPRPMGIVADAATTRLLLYPNPARGSVQVMAAADATRLALIDALGRVVREATLTQGTGTLDLLGVPAGVYSVRVGAVVKALVVE